MATLRSQFDNAPPASVLACSSLMAQAVICVLTERFDLDDEVIDVYRAISEPPFNRVGRVGRNAVQQA